jgi:hypothetical protein
MKEYLLTTNEYLEPKVLEGANAYAILILRLLLLEPGTNPLHPDMGVGLGPRYRFILEDEIHTLEDRIREQLQTYIPTYFNINSKVYMEIGNNKKLRINIVSNNTKYVFDTEANGVPIELSTVLR